MRNKMRWPVGMVAVCFLAVLLAGCEDGGISKAADPTATNISEEVPFDTAPTVDTQSDDEFARLQKEIDKLKQDNEEMRNQIEDSDKANDEEGDADVDTQRPQNRRPVSEAVEQQDDATPVVAVVVEEDPVPQTPPEQEALPTVKTRTVKTAWVTLHTADVTQAGTSDTISISMKNRSGDTLTVTDPVDRPEDQFERGMVEKYALDLKGFKEMEGEPSQFLCGDSQREPYELILKMEGNDWYVRGVKLEVECVDEGGSSEKQTLIENNAVNQVLGAKRQAIVLTRDDTAVMIEVKVADGNDDGTNDRTWAIFKASKVSDQLSDLAKQQIENATDEEPEWVTVDGSLYEGAGFDKLNERMFDYFNSTDYIANHLNWGKGDGAENDLRKNGRHWYGGTFAEDDPIEREFMILKAGTDGLAIDEFSVAVFKPGSDEFINKRGDCVKYVYRDKEAGGTGDAIKIDDNDGQSPYWPRVNSGGNPVPSWKKIETACTLGDIPFEKIEQSGTEFPSD